MRAWTLIVFFVALNASGYMIAQLADPNVNVLMQINSVNMPYSSGFNSTNPNAPATFGPFSLVNFSVSSIVAAIIGGFGILAVVAFFTKNAMFVVIAAVLWVMSCFAGVISWFSTGFSTMLFALLDPIGLSWIAGVFEAFMLVFFFFFLASLLSQRQDLT